METFLAIGAWLFIWVLLFLFLHPGNHTEDIVDTSVYIFLEFFVVGALIGVIRHDLHGWFSWVIIPVGILAWLVAVISLACATHNGENLWTALARDPLAWFKEFLRL